MATNASGEKKRKVLALAHPPKVTTRGIVRGEKQLKRRVDSFTTRGIAAGVSKFATTGGSPQESAGASIPSPTDPS